MYRSTKTFGHDLGLSACFRQWRATHSHCSKLHGYALSFRFEFEAQSLDDRNWVVDFGGLKDLKKKLVDTFDHKLVIAADDPKRVLLEALGATNVASVLILDRGVGCERFAEYAWCMANKVLHDYGLEKRVRVVSCECAEHGANSAIYINEK